jgi:predicted amidohydrolase
MNAEPVDSLAEALTMLASSTALDAGGLLAGLYELAKVYSTEILNAPASAEHAKKYEDWLERERRSLSSLLPSTIMSPGQAWRLPSQFSKRLADLVRNALEQGDQRSAVPSILKLGMQVLDEHLGAVLPSQYRETEPELEGCYTYRLVQSPLPPGKQYSYVARTSSLGPPWREEEPPESGANLGSEGWLRYGRLLPRELGGKTFTYCSLDPNVDTLLGQTRGAGEYGIRIGLWPVSRWLDPKANLTGRVPQYRSSGKPYNIFYLEEDAERANTLVKAFRNVLQHCAQEDVSLLVMPELTVGPTLLRTIGKELARHNFRRKAAPRPVLVVAGSRHLQDQNGRWINRATVLDHTGHPCTIRSLTSDGWGQDRYWAHDKIDRFGISKNDLKGNEHLLKQLGLDDDQIGGACEPQLVGRDVQVVDSSLGRLCLLICIDFLTKARKWHDTVQFAWFDWLLVPTASPLTEKYREVDFWAIDQSASVIANCCWLLQAMTTWSRADVALCGVPNPYRHREERFRWRATGGRRQETTSTGQRWSPKIKKGTCAWSCNEGCLLILEVTDPAPPGADADC